MRVFLLRPEYTHLRSKGRPVRRLLFLQMFPVLVLGLGQGTGWTADPVADKTVQQALHTLLLTADNRGPQSVGLALRRYQTAKALRDDSDTSYTYAIVLLRLTKTKEALAQLAQATEKQHVSAAQAQVALLMSQKQWTVATEHIEKYSDWLRDDNPRWKDDEARDQFAEWIGRAISVGQIVGANASEVERFNRLDQRVRGLMPLTRREAYIRGFDAVLQEEEGLANTTEVVQTEEEKKRDEAIAAEKNRLKNEQDKTKGDRENLIQTAEEWKKTLDNKLTEFGKQLGLMEKEWNTLDQRRQTLERSILLAQQEQQLLFNRYEALSSNNGNTNRNIPNPRQQTQLQQIDRELGTRQQQILQYQQDRNRTMTSMNQQYQQAQVVIAQRQNLVADYERATGQLVQKDESLKKWNDRLQKKEKDVVDGAKGKVVAVQTLDQRRKSVGTYLIMDWEAERQRLLLATQPD